MNRRRFITTASASISGMLLAGCVGEFEISGGGTPTEEPTPTPSEHIASGSGIAVLEVGDWEENFTTYLGGLAQNTTDSLLEYAQIEMSFSDTSGTQIGTGLDNTSNLQAEQRWEFSTALVGVDPVDIDSIYFSFSSY